MKAVVRWLVLMGIVLQFVFLGTYATAKGRGDSNARNVAEYISQLKAGANPDTLKRPQVRHLKGFRGKRFNTQLKKAMDDAEALARAGKQEKIVEIEVVE